MIRNNIKKNAKRIYRNYQEIHIWYTYKKQISVNVCPPLPPEKNMRFENIGVSLAGKYHCYGTGYFIQLLERKCHSFCQSLLSLLKFCLI